MLFSVERTKQQASTLKWILKRGLFGAKATGEKKWYFKPFQHTVIFRYSRRYRAKMCWNRFDGKCDRLNRLVLTYIQKPGCQKFIFSKNITSAPLQFWKWLLLCILNYFQITKHIFSEAAAWQKVLSWSRFSDHFLKWLMQKMNFCLLPEKWTRLFYALFKQ